jgi:hypothetical protein|tara:strand:- start:225 stop:431 length:207 start_codon:yes stop_codon:yes gene_type:complete
MIEKNILILLRADGFVRKFWEKTKNHKTYKAAYEELEKEYEGYFGQRRYSDYNSFRICRDRLTKKNKN